MKTYVLYHGACADGFGGAWAAWRKLGDRARYVPLYHGDPPPTLPEGASAVMVDFAYPREVILAMKERVGELVILDHHTTAEQDLAGLEFATFDMTKSGAILAWEYWHPDEPAPDLLRYVQDRDLWRFELPNSNEVNAAIASYPYDFRVWDELDVTALAREGAAILRFRSVAVEAICDFARVEELDGHAVPIVNTSTFQSDVGEALLRRYPDAPFAACYYEDARGRRKWSLRSRGDVDVSAIAARFGGGGHKSAAGFTEDR